MAVATAIILTSCEKEDTTIDYKKPDICMVILQKPAPVDGKYYFIYDNGKKVEVPKLSYETSKIGDNFCQLKNLEIQN